MKRTSEQVKIIVAQTEIIMTQYCDGSMFLEKNEDGRWFVSTKSDDCFYLQENLEDGEIRDLGFKDNLPEALIAIAWAR